MKKAIAVWLIFLATYFAVPAFAGGLSDADTTSLLCSGEWIFKGKNWSVTLTFKTDHTADQRGSKESLTWKIVDDKIVVDHGKYQDIVPLPLNPQGTESHSTKGYAFIASRADVAGQPASQQSAGNSAPGPGASAFGSSSQAVSTPAQPPAPQAPVSPEIQQKASDLVKAYHNDLVFVTGKQGSGSGFIATLGKANLVFTNAHVAAAITDAGFKTLDDAAVQNGAASVAVGRDVFCMAQPAGGKPFEIMEDVESNAGIGDDVVVLGNAGGEGVINTIIGKIVGIGSDRIEVDAPFVAGNSGSPIIHLKTGKVIGVATYMVIRNYDEATDKKTSAPVIRRFGYRIDNVKQWQGVDWRTFRAQAAEIQGIETLTADLGDFFDDISAHNGVVTTGRHTNPVIKTRIEQWQADRMGNRSATDANIANANFLSFLKVACETDVTTAKQRLSYDYFQRKLAEQQQIRDAMAKAFEVIIKNLGS